MTTLLRVFTDNIQFNEENHEYKIAGLNQHIYSVTQIINPTGIFRSPRVMAASELGTEAHLAFRNYLEGSGTEYNDAFTSLDTIISELDTKYSIGEEMSQEIEKRFVAEFLVDGEKQYIGGTCDAISFCSNATRIIELKTTTQESHDHLIQLAAYAKFAEFSGHSDIIGYAAYLRLKDGQQKAKPLHGNQLQLFWEQFLRKVTEFFASSVDAPDLFKVVDQGQYQELTQDDVRALMEEYSAINSATESLEGKKKKIREKLDAIADANHLNSFEINGAKYAKIQGVRKFIETSLVEEKYPELVKYVPFTRVTITAPSA